MTPTSRAALSALHFADTLLLRALGYAWVAHVCLSLSAHDKLTDLDLLAAWSGVGEA